MKISYSQAKVGTINLWSALRKTCFAPRTQLDGFWCWITLRPTTACQGAPYNNWMSTQTAAAQAPASLRFNGGVYCSSVPT